MTGQQVSKSEVVDSTLWRRTDHDQAYLYSRRRRAGSHRYVQAPPGGADRAPRRWAPAADGRVVSREGSLVSQALLAGIVGGFGRGFSANANSVFSGVTTNADGTRSKLSAGDILGGGLGQGAADAADTVSKYLIERAEQYQPVVEIPDARR